MGIASILRTLGHGFYNDEPILAEGPRRRFDFEMPGIGEDDEPVDTSTDLPGEVTQIGTKRTPKGWVRGLQQAAPGMLRGALVAASNPTPGKVGTAADILGGLNAAYDDRQQRDMLAYNRQRQAAKDAQDSVYSQARTREQLARAQMEEARANEYVSGKGRTARNPEEEIAQAEKALGRPLNEREKQTILKLYGPQYDARTTEQNILRGGGTKEDVLNFLRDKSAATQRRAATKDFQDINFQELSQALEDAKKGGDPEAIAEAKQNLMDWQEEADKRKRSFLRPATPKLEKTNKGIFSVQFDPVTNKLTPEPLQTKEGETLQPFLRPRAERQPSEAQQERKSAAGALNKVLQQTDAYISGSGKQFTEVQRLELAKKNLRQYYGNDPAVAPYLGQIEKDLDARVASAGKSSKVGESIEEKAARRRNEKQQKPEAGKGGVAGSGVTPEQVMDYRARAKARGIDVSAKSDEDIARIIASVK